MSDSEPGVDNQQAHTVGRRRARSWALGGAAAVVALVAVVAALRSERQDAGSDVSLGPPVAPAAGAGAAAADDRPSLLPITAYHGEEILGGRESDLAHLIGGGKPVVVNFWAGLCPPCRAEMPGFQRVYEEHRGAFILVGVDIGPFIDLGSHEDGRALLDELGITYPTAFARASPLRRFNIRSMPTTIFFTPDGAVFSERAGFVTDDHFRRLVDGLLAASR